MPASPAQGRGNKEGQRYYAVNIYAEQARRTFALGDSPYGFAHAGAPDKRRQSQHQPQGDQNDFHLERGYCN